MVLTFLFLSYFDLLYKYTSKFYWDFLNRRFFSGEGFSPGFIGPESV